MTLVRPAGPDDAAAVAAVYAPLVRASYATFEQVPPTPEQVAARMTSEPRLPWLVATDGDAVLGFAYAGRHQERAAYRWSVNVSVYLHDDARGRGVGRALYDRLLPELTATGLRRAFALIALPNPTSVALHESSGFTPCGLLPAVGHKLGAWRDVAYYTVALADDDGAAPTEPRPWLP